MKGINYFMTVLNEFKNVSLINKRSYYYKRFGTDNTAASVF
jgi:hypothetical protein